MKPILFIFVFFLTPTSLMAIDKGVVLRDSVIHLEAGISSDVVGRLKSGVKVDIIESKGGWTQIFDVENTLTGWVRSYQIRTDLAGTGNKSEKKSLSEGFFSGLANISRTVTGLFSSENSSNSPTTSTTATIGVRGLSENAIKTATPDFKELEKMKRYSSKTESVAAFARRGRLVVRDVAVLE